MSGNIVRKVTAVLCILAFSSVMLWGCSQPEPLPDEDTVQAESTDDLISEDEYVEDDYVEDEAFYTKLELGETHYHFLGSTYAEMCDWAHGETDNYGFMEADGCYYTSFAPNVDLEMRKADPSITDDVKSPDDRCFGISGWFGRIFDVESEGRVNAEDVIEFLGAENVTTMDATDELEAPGHLDNEDLLCMDIQLDTAAGTKKVRLEMDIPNNGVTMVEEDTWARIYILDE